MKKPVIEFVSTVLACICLGIILDFIVKTTWICTVVGLVVGLVVALIIYNKKRKDV